MGGFVLAFREVDEVEHIGGETEAIAELLNENTGIDNAQAFGLHVA